MCDWNILAGYLRQDLGKAQNETSYLEGKKAKGVYHGILTKFYLSKMLLVFLNLLLQYELCAPKFIQRLPDPQDLFRERTLQRLSCWSGCVMVDLNSVWLVSFTSLFSLLLPIYCRNWKACVSYQQSFFSIRLGVLLGMYHYYLWGWACNLGLAHGSCFPRPCHVESIQIACKHQHCRDNRPRLQVLIHCMEVLAWIDTDFMQVQYRGVVRGH